MSNQTRGDPLKPVNKAELWNTLPKEWEDPTLFTVIEEKVRQSNLRVVVVDDDPTGTQTVHSVSILTEWPVERLRETFIGSN